MIARATRQGHQRARHGHGVVPLGVVQATSAPLFNRQRGVINECHHIWVEPTEERERSIDIESTTLRMMLGQGDRLLQVCHEARQYARMHCVAMRPDEVGVRSYKAGWLLGQFVCQRVSEKTQVPFALLQRLDQSLLLAAHAPAENGVIFQDPYRLQTVLQRLPEDPEVAQKVAVASARWPPVPVARDRRM